MFWDVRGGCSKSGGRDIAFKAFGSVGEAEEPSGAAYGAWMRAGALYPCSRIHVGECGCDHAGAVVLPICHRKQRRDRYICVIGNHVEYLPVSEYIGSIKGGNENGS